MSYLKSLLVRCLGPRMEILVKLPVSEAFLPPFYSNYLRQQIQSIKTFILMAKCFKGPCSTGVYGRIDASTFRTNGSLSHRVVTETHSDSSGRQYDFPLIRDSPRVRKYKGTNNKGVVIWINVIFHARSHFLSHRQDWMEGKQPIQQ